MPGRFLVVRAALGGVVMLVALTILGAHAQPPAPTSLVGHYRVQDSGTIIAIADCGEGQLLWTNRGTSPKAAPQRAQQKVEPLQGDQLCGLTILTELQPTASGVWEGKFRDPILGGAYSLDISRGNAKSGPVLMVQRYRAPPFFTRSMARVEARVSVAPPTTPCGASAPTS